MIFKCHCILKINNELELDVMKNFIVIFKAWDCLAIYSIDEQWIHEKNIDEIFNG